MLLSASMWAQNFPFPQNAQWNYQHGIVAENVDNSKIQSFYSTWKSTFYEESGDLARIRFDNTDQTVSEGIGYGMLIFVYMENSQNNTQDEFDKLYNYYQNYGRFGGYLMDWKIEGFGEVSDDCKNNNNPSVKNCSGSATDGDLDVALALLLAHKQWGSTGSINYIQEAETLLGYIYDKQIEDYLIKPGDHWNDAYNPCYYTTASIGLFAQAQMQEGFSNSKQWDNVYAQCQTYLTNAQNNSSAGFYPDWTTNSITATQGSMGFDFSWDACRTPWRVAWDYAWYGNAKALAMSNKTIAWASSKAPGSIYGPMDLNGTPIGSNYNNTCFIGGIGSAFMANATYQSNLNTWYNFIANKTESDGYYAPTLQILYLLTMSGNAINFYAESIGPVAPRYTSGTNNPQNGSEITLSFSQELASSSTNSQNDFTIYIDGQATTISSVSLDVADAKNLILVIVDEIVGGQSVTVSYSGTSVKSTDNVALEAFTDETVKNTISDGYVIANCESEHITALGTSWFTFDDNADGGASTVTPLTSISDPFTMTVGGAAGTDNAAKIDFEIDEGTLGYKGYVGLGFNLNEDESPYDMSEATGIAFWHKGSTGNFEVILQEDAAGANYHFEIPQSDVWVQYNVPFADLVQYVWTGSKTIAWDATTIKTLQWKVQKGNSASSEEMWIDEVVAVGMPVPEADKSALETALSSANSTLSSASAGSGHNQYASADITAFENAIADAQTLYDDAAASQDDVDAMVTTLNEAVAAFEETEIIIDFSTLESEITSASTLLSGAATGTGNKQYPQDAYDALSSAINTADALVNETGATDSDVAAAVNDLQIAVSTFTETKIIIDFSSLTALIDQANSKKSSAVVGTNAGEYPQTAYNTFVQAISTASDLVDAAGATDADVTNAISDLNDAMTAFENSKNAMDISALTDALDNANGIINSATEGDGHNEYAASDIQTLQGVIDNAEAVKADPASQEEIDQMIQTLNSAVSAFEASIIKVDFTDLASEIQRATSISSSAIIGTGNGEYPQSAKTELDAAITTAETFNNIDGITQTEATQATEDLTAAIATFEASVNGLNTSTLTYAIENATQISTAAEAGTGHNQYNQADIDILNTAISNAQDVKTNSTSQDEINQATADLDVAITAFKESVIVVDFSGLESAITSATEILSVAVIGSGHNMYPAGSKATLQDAIDNADAIVDITGTTETDVSQMLSDLNDAIFAFEDSKIVVDFTALEAKISEATTLKNSAVTGTEEGQYPYSAYTTFSNAIVDAENISGADGVTTSDVEQAISDLDDAITVFQASVIGASVNFTVLYNAVGEATSLVNNANVGTGHEQYKQSDIDALSNELSAANVVLNNASATQEDVNTAASNLQSAINTFEAAQILVDFSALQAKVTESNNYVGTVTIGTIPGVWAQSTVDAFNSKIYDAQLLLDDKVGVTASEVASALSDLAANLTEFKTAYIKEQTGDTDFTVLTATINTANSILATAQNNEGTGSGEYSSLAINAFQTVLSNANAVKNNTDALQVEVDQAIYDLQDAIVMLKKSALENTITYAESIVDVNVGSNDGQHPVSAQTALQSDIDAALSILNSASASQSAVESATNALLSEISTFETTVNGGTQSGDLADVIAAANELLVIAKANEGNGIGEYPSTEIAIFQNAINNATAVENNANATDTEKELAANSLTSVQSSFVEKVVYETISKVQLFIDGEIASARLNELKDVQVETISINNNSESTDSEKLEAMEALVQAYNTYVGITDISVEKKLFEIYPNPTANVLNVNADVTSVSIFNISGVLVLESEIKTIDVSSLATGTYTIIASIDGKIQTASFFKQ